MQLKMENGKEIQTSIEIWKIKSKNLEFRVQVKYLKVVNRINEENVQILLFNK